MNLRDLDCCVSDADVIAKFSRSGFLEVLGRIVPRVILPEWVRQEALEKIGTHCPGLHPTEAIRAGWMEVVETDDGASLTQQQTASIRVFINSQRHFLDSGELRAAALANELGVSVMLSDDRNAQKIIQRETTICVLRLYEILTLGLLKDVLSETQVVDLFDAINRLQSHPVTIPALELVKRARTRFGTLSGSEI